MKKRITALLLCLIMALSLVPTSVWASGASAEVTDDGIGVQAVDPGLWNTRDIKVKYFYNGNWYPTKDTGVGNTNWYKGATVTTYAGSFKLEKTARTYYTGAPNVNVLYFDIKDSNTSFTRYTPGQTTGNLNASVYMIMYLSEGSQVETGIPVNCKILYIDGSSYKTEDWENRTIACQKKSHKNCTGASGTHIVNNSDIKAISDEMKANVTLDTGYVFQNTWTTTKSSSPSTTSISSTGTSNLKTSGSDTTIYFIAKKTNTATNRIFTLNYNANGGTGAPQSQTYVETDKVTLSHRFEIPDVTPKKGDLIFLGWSEDPKATAATYQPKGFITLVGSMTAGKTTTLYAVWKEKTPQIDNPEKPTETYLESLDGLVKLWCTTETTANGDPGFKMSTKLLKDTYSVDIEANDPYACVVTVGKTVEDLEKYAALIKDSPHEMDGVHYQDQKIGFTYTTAGKWELNALNEDANLFVKCKQTSVDPIKLGGGELNKLFQKNLTVTQGSTMAEEAFTITLTNKEDPTKTVSGTTALMSAPGVEPFTFTSGLTFDEAGTYTYTVKELKGSTTGMEYDKTEYTMTVEVYQDGNTLKYRTPTITDSNGQTVNGRATFTNTYKDPATEAKLTGAALSNLFQKSLTVNEAMTDGEEFEIVVKDAQGVEVACGNTAKMKTAKTEFFKFAVTTKLTFDKADTYTYTVEEVPGTNTDGKMTYDTTKYTMTVVVSEENNVLKTDVSFKPENDTTADPAGMVTFKNTYGTKTTPTAPTGDDLNGLVTVKCINPKVYDSAKDCSLIQYGVKADTDYKLKKITDEKYELVLSADPFVENYSKAGQALNRSHNLYSAKKLIWVLNYDVINSKWVGTPKTTGVDDTILVTHAPTDYREVGKIATDRDDVIKTTCVNSHKTTNGYGITVGFTPNVADKLSVVRTDKGTYEATFSVENCVTSIAKDTTRCTHTERQHDLLTSGTVTWILSVTKDSNGDYVWSAAPKNPGTDDICNVAHRVKVTFNENYNNVSTTEVMYKYNTNEVKEGRFPTNPTREGYTFQGWNTKADGNGTAFDTNTKVADDMTVYAQWEANALTIYYHGNGGKLENGKEQTTSNSKTDKEIAIKRNPFTRTGYTFVGWTTEKDGATIAYKGGERHAFSASEITNGEVHFWAKWEATKYTITYDYRDKDITNKTWLRPSNPTSYTIESDTIILNPITAKGESGKTFLEWRDANDGTGKKIEKIEKGTTGNLTIYAYWNYPVNYTVLDKDGKKIDALCCTEYFAEGESDKYTLRAAPAKDGYTFDGWYQSAEDMKDGVNLITGLMGGDKKYELCGKLTPNANTPYVVEHYQEQLDGTYKLVKTENLAGTTDTTVTAVAKSYTGFTYDETVKGTVKSGTIAGNGSLVLKLYYTRNSYTVTFQPDNGDKTTTTKVDYGAKVTKPATDPTKTGYTFVGWFADGANTAFKFDETTITGDITLTAHWEKQTYTVKFDSKGGSNVPEQKVQYKDKAAEPKAPTKSGYTFDGWYTDEQYTTKYNFANEVTGNMTLYAKWDVKRTGTNPDAKNPYIKDNTTKTDGKKVESGKTFDAGIALYVGLGILSLTGSAAAIYKRREEY